MKRTRGFGGSRFLAAGLLFLSLMLVGASPVPSKAAAGGRRPAPTPAVAPRYVPGALLVKPRPGVAESALVARAGGRTIDRRIPSIGVDRIEVPVGQELTGARRLQESGLVQYAVPDYVRHTAEVTPDDPLYATDQWDLPLIGMPAAWSVTQGSASVVVAVIDTGLDLAHPDRPAHLIPGPVYSSLGPSDGCPPEGPTPADDNGHGTHVTGTIAAGFDNGRGIAGMAPAVRVLAIKAGDCAGNLADSDIILALDYAAGHGARVINMSFGGPGADPAIADAVFSAWCHDAVLVAAAGNERADEYFIPADLPQVVAVAATDGADRPASYSNWGPAIGVAAPGGDYLHDPGVWSTYAPVGRDCPGQLYCSLIGTSMATPHVAAEAALIRSIAPTLANTQVVSIIESAVDPIQGAPSGESFGTGRINVHDALLEAQLAPPLAAPSGCHQLYLPISPSGAPGPG